MRRVRMIVLGGILVFSGVSAIGLEVDGIFSAGAAAAGETGTEGSVLLPASNALTMTQRFTEDAVIILQGSAALETSFDPVSSDWSFSVDRFSFEDTINRNAGWVFSYTVGRAGFADYAGILNPLTADGIVLAFKRPTLQITGLASTTALLQPGEFPNLTLADSAVAADDDRIFGLPRLLGNAGVFLPERWGRANVGIEYLYQTDLAAALEATDDSLSSGYLTIFATHPLGSRLFGFLAATGSHGSYEDGANEATTLLGGHLVAAMRGFGSGPLRPSGSLRLQAASGGASDASLPDDPGGTDTAFYGDQIASVWTAAPVGLRNVVAATAEGRLTPTDWLTFAGTSTLLAKPALGDAGIDHLLPETRGVYGLELGTTLEIKPFGDLDFDFAGSIFLPLQSGIGVFDGNAERSWSISATATLLW